MRIFNSAVSARIDAKYVIFGVHPSLQCVSDFYFLVVVGVPSCRPTALVWMRIVICVHALCVYNIRTRVSLA